MSNLSKLQKEARKAKKFYLAAFNPELSAYVFVSDKDKCKEDLTVNVSKAVLFSYGFDDEAMKEKAWSVATGFDFIAVAV